MKDQKFSFKRSLLCMSVVAATALTGCGGTGQDEGQANTSMLSAKGLTIDGYLARATVFIDSNNNGTRDAWEPWAFTDNDGYYSFNPNTGVDYCASTATAQQMQYCLTSNIEYGNAVVRIEGGYDVTTGEPFLGQLNRRTDLSSGVSDLVITPVTTLLSDTSATERSNLLNVMGMQESDLDVDYFNADTDGDGIADGQVNTNILNAALKIHKTVSVLSDRLQDTYTDIGEEPGTPSDPSAGVYSSLAQQLLSAHATDASTRLRDVLSDNDALIEVMDNAESRLRSIYEQNGFVLPTDLGSVESPGSLQRVTSVASRITDVVDVLIDTSLPTVSIEDAQGSARALESLVIKTVKDNSDTDSSVENAIEFFTNTDNSELVTALKDALKSDNADISGLSNNDFSGDDFDSVEEITQVSKFSDDVAPFSQIAGMTFKISDLDLGTSTNLDDKEYEFYFQGDVDDIDGAFTACFKHIDGAKPDGTLGEGNTRGEIVDGFWSLLGASSEKADSYSLLITITFLGTTYQGILKPGGMQTIDDVEYNKVRFEYDDEALVVHSEDGFVATDSIPTSNQDCEARLPSRVGL